MIVRSKIIAFLVFFSIPAQAKDPYWNPVARDTAIGYLDQVLDRLRFPQRYFPGYQPGEPLRVVFDGDGVLFNGHNEWREVKGAAQFLRTCLNIDPAVVIEVATARELWHQERTRNNIRQALGLVAGGLEGGRIHVHYNKELQGTEDYKYRVMVRHANKRGRIVAAFENTPANSIAWWHALENSHKNENVLHFLVTAQLNQPHEHQKERIQRNSIDLKRIDHYHGYPRFKQR